MSARDTREGVTFVQGRSFRPTLVAIGQLHVIDSEQMQDGGVKIVDVQTILDGMQTDFVRATDDSPTFHTAACHPHGKSVGIVVATVPFFAHWRPTKFAAPNDERFVEQSALLEIAEQNRLQSIEPQAALLLFLAVAGIATPGQNRPNFRFKESYLFGFARNRAVTAKCRPRQPDETEENDLTERGMSRHRQSQNKGRELQDENRAARRLETPH